MEDAIAAFASYLSLERMRQTSTVARYVRVLRDFGRFLKDEARGAEIALEEVDKNTLSRFMRRGMEDADEPSRSVWNARLAALRAFYGYLFRQEKISVNPAHRLDRFKVHAKEPVPLSLDEYLALVSAMSSARRASRNRNIAIIEVMFHCALRVAEVVSLDLSQVDLENYVFLDVRTKGNKRLSAVFNDVVAEAIERHLKERGTELEETALFLSDRGARLSVRTVQELVKSYAKKAGISRTVTPHLLRHSSATQLVELGTPIRVVQEICGHSSVTTTERYVHVNGGARRRAIDALGVEVQRRFRRAQKEVGQRPNAS
jgi:site-specific recombinase XerD